MSRSMITIAFGVLCGIGSITGFVLASSHERINRSSGVVYLSPPPSGHWTQETYDIVRIATWSVLLVAVVAVVAGLIAYSRR